MSVASRMIPEDPARFAELEAERAAFIAGQLRAITGRQHRIVSCFWCQQDYPEGDDGYRVWPGPDYVCADESKCLDRAAQAGAVLAFGQQGDGGARVMTTLAEAGPLVIDQPGVYEIPEADYHHDPVPGGSLSSTGARRLLPPSCPAKFKYEQDHPVFKDVYDFGTVAHKFVLGSGPEVAVLDFEDWRTRESRERRDEARAAGIVPVLAADWERAREMAAAVRAHPVAGKLLDPARGGFAEQSLFWQDPEFGIWCRARLDWMREAGPGRRFAIADYKTADSADPDAFARSAANYGYDQQDAFYGDGVRVLGLDENPMFVFVVQDKNPPYLVSICELDEEDRYAGRRRNQIAAEIYRDCAEAGNWPGYGDEINHVKLPAWSRARHLRGSF